MREGLRRREEREFWARLCFLVPAADLLTGGARTQHRATEFRHAQALELRNPDTVAYSCNAVRVTFWSTLERLYASPQSVTESQTVVEKWPHDIHRILRRGWADAGSEQIYDKRGVTQICQPIRPPAYRLVDV